MEVNDKERDDIIIRLTRITDIHEKLINGDEKLGIKGLRERQEQDVKVSEMMMKEIRGVRSEMQSIHGEIKKEVETKFKELRILIQVMEDWKTGIQTSVKYYTSWGFWIKVTLVMGLIYQLIVNGVPAAVEWIGDKISL